MLQSLDTYYDTDGVPVIVWSVREEERIYFHRQQTSSKSSRESRNMKPAPEQVGIPMASLVLVEGVKDPRGLAVDWIGRNLGCNSIGLFSWNLSKNLFLSHVWSFETCPEAEFCAGLRMLLL